MSARGWALFTAMSVIWGVPYLLIKIALEELSVPVVVFARTFIGAAVLLPLAFSPGIVGVLRKHWKPLLAFAFLEIIAAWLFLSDAETRLSSSTTGLLIAATPIIAAILERLTGGIGRLGVPRITGLVVGLIGVSVLAGHGLAGGGAWPVTEVLLVSFCYASAPLIAARHLGAVPPLPMTAACLGLAALVYAPAAAFSWPAEMPSGRVLVATVLLALMCTALAFVLFFALIREAGPSRAVVITYLNPAVALAAGVIILGEPLTPSSLIGLALILIGSALATRPSSAAAGPAEAN